jgi:hypothetical protein
MWKTIVGCLTLAVSGSALGQSVRVNTYQGTSSSTFSSTTVPTGDPINVSADYQISRICIFTDGGGSAADIGPITITHAGGVGRSGDLQVILMDRPGNFSFPSALTNLDPVGTD